jgi:hypothetical protein
MRPNLATLALVLASILPGIAAGQQSLPTSPPPNPQQIVPDQRLENVDQRLFTAAEQLKEAAESGEQGRIDKAVGFGRQTIQEVRDVFNNLPEDKRLPYEEAFLKAEQALQGGDPHAGAAAMQTLQQQVRELVQRGT